MSKAKVLYEYSLKQCSFCGGNYELRIGIIAMTLNSMMIMTNFTEGCGAIGKVVEILNARYQKDCEEKLKKAAEEGAEHWNRRTCLCKHKEN